MQGLLGGDLYIRSLCLIQYKYKPIGPLRRFMIKATNRERESQRCEIEKEKYMRDERWERDRDRDRDVV